jgi:hypothetical protein
MRENKKTIGKPAEKRQEKEPMSAKDKNKD